MPTIFDESNYHLLLPNDDGIISAERGGGFRRYCGFQPRPAGRKLSMASRSAIKLIPRSQWPALIKQMEDSKTRLSDFYERSNCPVLDQDGFGWCHGFSACDALFALRALSRQELVDLSPASIAGPVTNWRNQGAWIGDDLESCMKIGCATREFVPDFCTNPSRCKEGWKENAKLHRATDCFELGNRNFDEVMTYLLCRIPVCVGYNWWGHAVTLLDPVCINGRFGVRLLNSWSTSWEDGGFGVLMEGKGTPDESYVLLATPLLTASVRKLSLPTRRAVEHALTSIL